MLADKQTSAVAAEIHMIQCNITAARYGVISNDPEMVAQAINQIDAIVSNLKKKTEVGLKNEIRTRPSSAAGFRR